MESKILNRFFEKFYKRSCTFGNQDFENYYTQLNNYWVGGGRDFLFSFEDVRARSKNKNARFQVAINARKNVAIDGAAHRCVAVPGRATTL